MLYIIGLGLNVDGISKYGLETVKKCKRVYLENYTVEFPYSQNELKDVLGKKIIPADRKFVENLSIIDEAKKIDVALLVYGNPLTATTHITLIDEAKKSKVRHKIIYSASILDALGETGLQIYKFGKITSMPKWDEKKKFTPDSFAKIIKENQSIKAHSLILIDIGLEFTDALEQLKTASKNNKVNLKKILICSRLGTKHRKILYKDINELENYQIKSPYCMIIPSELHFVEKEFLENL